MRELLNLAHSLRVEHLESSPMFRAVVFSIALTVAAGPSAALLCRIWCDPPVATASACHRHTTSTTSKNVAADGTCNDMRPSVAAFAREALRRGVSAPEAHNNAVSVPRYHLAHTPTNDRYGQSPWSKPSLEKRPLSTNLRI